MNHLYLASRQRFAEQNPDTHSTRPELKPRRRTTLRSFLIQERDPARLIEFRRSKAPHILLCLKRSDSRRVVNRKARCNKRLECPDRESLPALLFFARRRHCRE